MNFILTLSCHDRPGIVAAVSGFLAEHRFNIRDSAQFGDAETGLFFMRVSFEDLEGDRPAETVRAAFAPVAAPFAMTWAIHDEAAKPRVLIMVSKFGHCLNDLLYRYSIGALPVEIPAIVSNHRDWYQRAAAHDIPYYHWPVTPETKAQQEERLLDLIQTEKIELVILARYMQVLSPTLCHALAGKIINIHHSFLPSFKGAKPYHQAHARGVKLIGATAHYVTDDLDEGPIIEQEVARVDHAYSPDQLAATGRDIESLVLARAVKYHVEHRIFLNGHKTVVFRG
ncbi:formyltetrahydrofolate deformylase [uncultured Ferrovibrio sp.]|jgi:formyltetrahydrofolate deformylase|uniref:formyltetrahydrofolate deformylase n=1 Tax=uncultured Ferrovibrio sp. TaxID=1576913 RepID=UPI002631848F|nr:formyltetrahydrofolate deformylase [uncultured Ferrovibrio sp.]